MPPGGLFLPAAEARLGDGVTAQVTRDGLGDRLGQWWATVRERAAPRTTWASIATMGQQIIAGVPNAGSAWSLVSSRMVCLDGWPRTRRPLARTPPWTAAGASWSPTGMGRSSTPWRRGSSVPAP